MGGLYLGFLLNLSGQQTGRLDYLVAQDSQAYDHSQYYDSQFQVGGSEDVSFDFYFCVQFHASVIHCDEQYHDCTGLAEDAAIVLVSVVKRKFAYNI